MCAQATLSTDESSREMVAEKKSRQRPAQSAVWRRSNYGPDCYHVFEIDTIDAQRPSRWNLQRPHAHAFFFYHPLCRPAGVDSQSPILNSRDAKCCWNDCTRRDAFYFAWISSSSRWEQSTSRSRVIVCYRRLRVSSKFLRGPLSRNVSRALQTHRWLYDVPPARMSSGRYWE